MNLLSVIIPVYNQERDLRRCLDSVCRQTYDRLEIIVINNGSTDGSLDIMKAYREIDPRVKVIDQDNRGVSAGRNIGMAQATGSTITFVDGDDWLDLSRFEKMIDLMEKKDCDVVMAGFTREYSDSKTCPLYEPVPLEKMGMIPVDVMREALLTNQLFTPVWDKVYRRAMLQENNIRFIEDLTIREDFFFNLDVCDHAGKIFYLDESLYHYQMASSVKTRRFHPDFFEISIRLYEYKLAYLKKWFSDMAPSLMDKMKEDFLDDVGPSLEQLDDPRNHFTDEKKARRRAYILDHPLVVEAMAIKR